MKTVIAGSRSIGNIEAVNEVMDALKKMKIVPTLVISGCAKGVDLLGEQWAQTNNIPIHREPADWKNLTVPNARIKTNSYGEKYNANAGHQRNNKMALMCDVVVAVWDGRSPGTQSMINYAKSLGKKVVVYEPARRHITVH